MGLFHREFNIQSYMTRGVNRVVVNSLRAVVSNEKEAEYMRSFAKAASKASAKRAASEKAGEHIPPFLIASITSSCNLHCAGCYSRANHACSDKEAADVMSAAEWERIFSEAEDLGISFILLAGGEPLLRRDVIESAASHPGILFPVFTNGTFINGKYLDLFDKNRNILPIISIEGDREVTDSRRGSGVYDKIREAMSDIKSRGMIFGVSVTVTAENMEMVYSDEFIDGLYADGCKAIIYVEYVPVDGDNDSLAPGEDERKRMKKRVRALRLKKRGMVFISFPGDEKSSGGCVAAGRGFFHINSHGGAEPCPFSPYSDCSVRETSVREALRSPLFYALNTQGLLKDDHAGGCTLYANKDKVERIIAEQNNGSQKAV
ncbi:MAG: radical SAM protein [Clostridia bacterium]|nr:radical SAM protein [Clostridia bacterium]